jgi:hypothetical protein
VTASESVELIGTSANGSISSNLNTLTFGDGNAGNLSITTGRLILRDGAAISTSSVVTPMQNPGSVQGRSGNLTINASESVEITGSSATGGFGGLITVETQTDGDAGNLEISTGTADSPRWGTGIRCNHWWRAGGNFNCSGFRVGRSQRLSHGWGWSGYSQYLESFKSRRWQCRKFDDRNWQIDCSRWS